MSLTNKKWLRQHIKSLIRANSSRLNNYQFAFQRHQFIVRMLKRSYFGSEELEKNYPKIKALIWKCLYELKDEELQYEREHHFLKRMGKEVKAEKKKKTKESNTIKKYENTLFWP